MTITVGEDAPADCRLDRYLAESLDLMTRSQLKARAKGVSVNGTPARLSRRVRPGDVLELEYVEKQPLSLSPEPMALRILFEDHRVIVLNKRQGRVVHPGVGNWTGTLVAGVLAHAAELGDQFGGEDVRPGVVHRLDKDTSGVIVLAKNPQVHQQLAQQFKARTVKKVYYAILKGAPPSLRGRIDAGIGRDPRNRQRFRAVAREGEGRGARTDYRVLARWAGHCFVRFAPQTGRTHQLRVHSVSIGCPILGDPIYARADPVFPDATLMLHAYSLRIHLPGDTESRRFRAPLDDRFYQVLSRLGQQGVKKPENGAQT
jgi:23S rRNA pseudouridine1911/1915/1917 synthase